MENTESEVAKRLTLYQKLHKIQSKINGLGKDKDTKSQYNPNGYKYVTGDKVLREIKPLMNEYGLLLKQEVVSIDNERQDYQVKNGQKSEILSKVMMQFTWIDVETGEIDVNSFGANGQNDWEKGLGSALTYAERYFLLKFFHIATDEDDIDNPDRKTSEPIPQKPAPLTQKPKDILVQNSTNWNNIIKAMTEGMNGKKYTLIEIENKYTITEKDKELLLEKVAEIEMA
jgi:hypothetical protein